MKLKSVAKAALMVNSVSAAAFSCRMHRQKESSGELEIEGNTPVGIARGYLLSVINEEDVIGG